MLGKHINHCEDSLTAVVFTHLLHLPTELFWQILRNACYSDQLPKIAGEPTQVDPWPIWDATGSDNINRVVPDLFMRFAEFDLIIEAKRWDEGMQDPAQWQRELVAYANEYGERNRPVRLIALGGIHGTEDEEIQHRWHPDSGRAASSESHLLVCPVHMCRWEGVLSQCQRQLRQWESRSRPDSQILASMRILHDLIDLIGWHGFATGRWFADFNFSANRLSPSIVPHLVLFKQCSRQFQRA